MTESEEYDTEMKQTDDLWGEGRTSWKQKKLEEFDVFPGADMDQPWKDEELLRWLYEGEKMSMLAISEGWDCAPNTVRSWLDKFGVDRRSQSEQINISYTGHPHIAKLGIDSDGYMRWTPGDNYLSVHRLLAVALWGFDEVCGMHVHHKNEIRWDNRPENLELVTNENHQRKHLKVEGTDRLAIAEMYESTDASSYQIADAVDHDICPGTVMDIWREFYE